MATFTIHEFGEIGYSKGSAVNAFSGTQTDQTAITTSGTSQQSAAFATTTQAVRVCVTGAAVRIKFGTNPTATAASLLLADGAVFDYATGGAAMKVAVIDV